MQGMMHQPYMYQSQMQAFQGCMQVPRMQDASFNLQQENARLQSELEVLRGRVQRLRADNMSLRDLLNQANMGRNQALALAANAAAAPDAPAAPAAQAAATATATAPVQAGAGNNLVKANRQSPANIDSVDSGIGNIVSPSGVGADANANHNGNANEEAVVENAFFAEVWGARDHWHGGVSGGDSPYAWVDHTDGNGQDALMDAVDLDGWLPTANQGLGLVTDADSVNIWMTRTDEVGERRAHN